MQLSIYQPPHFLYLGSSATVSLWTFSFISFIIVSIASASTLKGAGNSRSWSAAGFYPSNETAFAISFAGRIGALRRGLLGLAVSGGKAGRLSVNLPPLLRVCVGARLYPLAKTRSKSWQLALLVILPASTHQTRALLLCWKNRDLEKGPAWTCSFWRKSRLPVSEPGVFVRVVSGACMRYLVSASSLTDVVSSQDRESCRHQREATSSSQLLPSLNGSPTMRDITLATLIPEARV